MKRTSTFPKVIVFLGMTVQLFCWMPLSHAQEPRYSLRFSQYFNAPAEKVFPYISDPRKMSQWIWGGKLKRVVDSPVDPINPNGPGSVRKVVAPLIPAIEETVLTYEFPHLFEYSVTKSAFFKNHHGRITLSSLSTGCLLEWEIDFDAKIPHTGKLMEKFVRTYFKTGLAGLSKRRL